MIPPDAKHDPVRAGQTDFQWLVENSADILCSVAIDQLICYISPSCLEILGWQQAEMIGRDLREFILSDDLAALECMEVGKPSDGTAYTHARLRFLRKGQGNVWISANARCVLDLITGEPSQYVLSMRDVTGRAALEEELSALAMTDTLTGLWNRRAFDQALWRECKRTRRRRPQLSLLLLDLDQFKPLNDQYGHPLGDECLVTVAAAIKATVRATDIVCRWGGDEIAVILPATDRAGALHAAEKLRTAIEALRFQSKRHSGKWISVTASIGVATAQPELDTTVSGPRDLFLAADRALYQAKHRGHNCIATASLVPAGETQTREATSSALVTGSVDPMREMQATDAEAGALPCERDRPQRNPAQYHR